MVGREIWTLNVGEWVKTGEKSVEHVSLGWSKSEQRERKWTLEGFEPRGAREKAALVQTWI